MSGESNLEKLSALKTELDNLRRRKIEIQSDLKNLDAEKGKLLIECEKLKVNPKEITKEIDKQGLIIESTMESVKKELESLHVLVNP